MPVPNRESITVYQGQTLAKAFQLVNEASNPFNLTAYTARAQVRINIDDTATQLSLTSPVVSGIGIELGGVTGLLTIRLSAVATAELATYNQPQSWIYDLELVDSAQSPAYVIRVLEGSFITYPEVTRS